jgi:hypothetical protein
MPLCVDAFEDWGGMEQVPMREIDHTTSVSTMATDTRSAAIVLMSQALELIDSDPTISGIAGAQLQMAIDSVCLGSTSMSQDLH